MPSELYPLQFVPSQMMTLFVSVSNSVSPVAGLPGRVEDVQVVNVLMVFKYLS